jgi:hypothetical protein
MSDGRLSGWPYYAWAGGTWLGIVLLTMLLVAVSNKTWNLKVPFPGGCNSDPKVCKLFPGGVYDIADARGDQCEAVDRTSTVLEFQNTWSNFAYLLVGIFILFRNRNLLGINVGANLCTLFLFSGLYHASLQPISQTMDVAWLYCVMLSLIFYGISCVVQRFGYPMRFGLELTLFLATYFLGLMMAVTRTKIDMFDSTNAFVQMAVMLLGLAVAGATRTDSSFDPSAADGNARAGHFGRLNMMILLCVLLGVVCVAGFACRLLDGGGANPRLLCSPKSVIQAHAVWHILSAAAILFTYEIYVRISGRSESVFSEG